MSNNNEERQYTEEEIKNMDYWQLWQLRRKSGKWYFFTLMAVYSFLIYAFFKVLYILRNSNELVFKVDLWAIPLFLLAGPIYYYGHEWYYKNIYMKKKQ